MIGECVNRMASAVETFGGEVTAFMGDGIASFFGLDGAREDDHDRAAMAAIDIRRLIGEYAAEVEAAWGFRQFSVRIGVNSGRVAVGTLRESATQVHALGDAVNVAARLQSLAPPGSILMGSVVAATLADRFDVVSRGPKELKGRAHAVEVFELLGEAKDAPSVPSRPMLGRGDELARLGTAVHEVRSGRGQMVIILGEPGIGKTRLLQEARGANSASVTWLEGRCDHSTRRLPYGPFVRALHQWLEVERGTADVAVRVRLKAKLRELFGDRDPDVSAHLGGMLGVELEPKERRRLQGLPVEALTKGLHQAYGRWIEALTKSCPVVVAIDNFGQADQATVQLTEHLLALAERIPLLLLLAMRADVTTPGWRVRSYGLGEFVHRTSELVVQPLARSDSESLLQALDLDEVLSPNVREVIMNRAEGNPLYVEELVHAVADQAATVSSNSSITAVPPGLERLLLARVDALSREARRLLQAAAVLGRSFSLAVLERMKVVRDTEDALLEALRADLIREHRLEPIEYQFKHGLIREAVVSTLTAATTKDLHSRAARAIELCFAPHLEEHVEALAEHYESAGDHQNAVEFIEGIAERLVGVYRYTEAIHALDVCRRYLTTDQASPSYVRATMKSAELRGLLGRGREAAAQLDELLTREDSSLLDTQTLLAMKAQVLTESGALDEASHVIDQFEALGAHPRSPLIACMTAQIHLRRETLPAARAALEALGSVDELSGDLAFAACSMWAGYFAKTGRFRDGAEWAARALDLAQQGGSIALTLRAERYFGVMKLLDGEISRAYSLLRRVWVSYQELGATIGEIETAINLVYAAELRGLLRVGWDVGKSSLDVADSRFWRAALSANLATTALELGDDKNARALAMEVLEAADEVPPFARFVALIALGDLHAGKKEWQQAEHCLRSALEETEDATGRGGQRVSALTAISSLALRRGHVEVAKQQAQQAVASIPGSERPVHVAAFRALGSALCARDVDAGRVYLERALGLSRELGMKLEEGRALAALGSVVKERSNSYFDRAQQLFEECEAERGLAELDELRQR